jgi:hypothetical protein
MFSIPARRKVLGQTPYSFFFLNCHCVFMKYKLSLWEGNAFWVKDKFILNYVKFYLRLYIYILFVIVSNLG